MDNAKKAPGFPPEVSATFGEARVRGEKNLDLKGGGGEFLE